MSGSVFAANCPSSADFSFDEAKGLQLSGNAQAEGWHLNPPGKISMKIDSSTRLDSYIYTTYNSSHDYPPGVAVCVYSYDDYNVINASNSRGVDFKSIPMPPYYYSFPLYACPTTTAGNPGSCSWTWSS